MHRVLPVWLLLLVTIQQACQRDEPRALTGPKTMPSSSAANTLRFTAITAGYDHTCALTPGGAAYCWGRGYTDDGTQIVRLVPTPVPGGLRFRRLSKFGNCGVTPGGEAYCEIGVSTSPVAGGLHFKEVGVNCGLTPGGDAYRWGSNFYGELGIGNYTGPEQCAIGTWRFPCSTLPVPVAGGLRFAALSVGSVHSCGLTPNGAAYCWGRRCVDFGPGENEPGAKVFATSPTLIGGEHRFAAVAPRTEVPRPSRWRSRWRSDARSARNALAGAEA